MRVRLFKVVLLSSTLMELFQVLHGYKCWLVINLIKPDDVFGWDVLINCLNDFQMRWVEWTSPWSFLQISDNLDPWPALQILSCLRLVGMPRRVLLHRGPKCCRHLSIPVCHQKLIWPCRWTLTGTSERVIA